MANWTMEPAAWVLRSSTAGFSAGATVNQLEAPSFGMLLKAEPRTDGRETVYGLLYDIHIDDDPLVRQLILANAVTEEAIRDQRHHRIVPVEMSVLAVGYRTYENRIRYALPPKPPLSLDPVFACDANEVYQLTESFEYFRLVLGTPTVPGEQLLAATLLIAASVLPEDEQYDFLVRAGQEAARLLSGDLPRLDSLLRLMHPQVE